jgi:hypothetical protein
MFDARVTGNKQNGRFTSTLSTWTRDKAFLLYFSLTYVAVKRVMLLESPATEAEQCPLFIYALYMSLIII